MNLTDLTAYFATATLPPAPIALTHYETITDTAGFVASALYRAGRGNEQARGQLERLRAIIEQGAT